MLTHLFGRQGQVCYRDGAERAPFSDNFGPKGVLCFWIRKPKKVCVAHLSDSCLVFKFCVFASVVVHLQVSLCVQTASWKLGSLWRYGKIFLVVKKRRGVK